MSEPDAFGSGYGLAANFCEHGNGPSFSIRGGDFFDLLNN